MATLLYFNALYRNVYLQATRTRMRLRCGECGELRGSGTPAIEAKSAMESASERSNENV